ncbi:sugar kinase [Protaetiibacter intestinalis]|uniref:Sugar kinase n=1 Tax=Protaetiibacter intestinalis TaxID=2419774 RepID=A0A387BIN5_9MICO|nr:sugar kinase [Protaetiibacter intestinalis]AYF98390.1 sugar kinase [Protaetiibacter intestinalis]
MSGRLVTLGEALGVLRTPGIGTLARLDTLTVGTGGAEGNVAIGAARLGAAVTWIGRVGDDGLGQRILRELRAEGVEVRAAVDTAATGLLLKETPTPGRTRVTYHRAGSAGSRLSPADLDGLALGAHDILHLTGITPALSVSAAAAVRHAAELARAAGATVSYDVNHRAALWAPAEAVPVHRELVALADIVFAGDDEARLVLGSDSRDPEVLARGLAALGPREAVVKLGEAGAVALVDGRLLRRDAIPVPTVVDTVGAGDAFVAGYLAERLAGAPPEERLALAVATGAAACLHPGDWEGAPTRAELCTDGDPVIR